MNDDVLDRLRRANPVPGDVEVPPFSAINAHVSTGSEPRRRRLPTGWLVPTLAVTVAIAVAVAAVVLVGGRPRHGSAATTSVPATPPAPTHLYAPRGGLRGSIDLVQVNFGTGGDGVIAFDQCQPCHQAVHGANVAFHGWLAVSRDGGGSWVASRRPFTLDEMKFSGRRDGWAVATDTAVHLYVTHDGGLTWHRPSVGGSSPLAGSVSVAGGETWATTAACLGAGCTVRVLRGPASGNTLRPTPTAVPGATATASMVRAANAATAFVESTTISGGAVRDYVTHDGGASWRRVATVCAPRVSSSLEVAGDAVWEACPVKHHGGEKIAVSADDGRHWSTHALPRPDLLRLWPFSADVAWTMSSHGIVLRTTDGGAHWATMFSGGPVPRGMRASAAAFSAQDALTATLVATLKRSGRGARRTNLIIYRTTDGGVQWRPSVIALPTG